MKITVTKQIFRDQFRKYDRENNFTHEGLGLLFDYLEETEDICQNNLELDLICLCLQFSEYTAKELELEFKEEDETMEELEERLWNEGVIATFSNDVYIIEHG